MLNESQFFVNNLSPVALQIGKVHIYWYSLSYLFGALFVYFAVNKTLYLSDISLKNTTKKNFLDDLMFYAMAGVILGGRLGYCLIYNLSYYLQNPVEIFFLWQGGMSFHGGLLGVAFAIYLFAKKYNTDFLKVTDLVACFVPFALLLGRLANFVNQELYGAPTDVFWAVIFPNVDNIPRHPSQLYEAFLEGFVLLFIMLFLLFKTKAIKQAGFLSSFLLIFYSIFRFFVEFFRLPDAHIGYIFSVFTLGHLLSLVFLLIGILLLGYSYATKK